MLTQLNAGMDQQAAFHMSIQRIAAILPIAQAEGTKLGLAFDQRTPGVKDALWECLKAYRKAWQEVTKRDRGEVIETPVAPTRANAAQAKSVNSTNPAGRQSRSTPWNEWSPTERFVSGSAPPRATRPFVDVQSVLCRAASPARHTWIEFRRVMNTNSVSKEMKMH